MSMSLLVVQSLTLGTIIRGIPHDAAAIMGYIMVALFAAVLVLGSITRKKDPPGPTGSAGGKSA
jgi:hypothetical protein